MHMVHFRKTDLSEKCEVFMRDLCLHGPPDNSTKVDIYLGVLAIRFIIKVRQL